MATRRQRARKHARRVNHQQQGYESAVEAQRRALFALHHDECEQHRKRRKQGRPFYVREMKNRGWTEADIEALTGVV